MFQIPRGFVLTGKVARTGRTLPRLVELQVAGCGGALELDSTTGAIRLNWIPAGKATTGFMSWFDVSSMASCIPIAIPAADQNLDIGTIAIPPSWNFDASIEVTELDATVERPLQSLYNSHAEGFTLISVDGLKLFDSMWSSVTSRGGVVNSGICQVPAGTYYIVPDFIGPTDFQLKLFGKIVAGTDLTQSGVPRIVIAAGETKHVEIHSVQIINAIYALP